MAIKTKPICPKCGFQLNDGAKFCAECRNNIKMYFFFNGDYRVTLDDENIIFEQKVFSSIYTKKIKINNILEISYKSTHGWDGSDNIKIITIDGNEIKIKMVLGKGDDESYKELCNHLNKLVANRPSEIRKKCNVCGNIFCYNVNDILVNNANIKSAAISSLGTMASAVVGTRYDAYEQNKMANTSLNKIIDFNKCPNCGSTNLSDISNESVISDQTNNILSAADEIKKYKELLDCGAISQEEFDVKKKQLLGL